MHSPLHRWTLSVATLDVRALALFRVGLAVAVLADLGTRAVGFEAHLTERGVLTAARAAAELPSGRWSLYLLAPADHAVATGMAAEAASAVALAVGWHTRAATAVCWVLAMSLQARNPLVLGAVDALLRLLLFWSLFLPLGATASWDARGRRPPGPVCTAATGALVAQVSLVYVVTMALKTDPVWWDGRAVGDVLQADLLVTRLGKAVAATPGLPTLLTWVTVTWELLGVALALSPVALPACRTAAVLGFVALHAGFGALLGIGVFPLVSAVGWLAFLPGPLLDHLGWRGGTDPTPRLPPAATAAVAGALALVLAFNGKVLGWGTWHPALSAPTHALGLDQTWNMFAPSPPGTDGWYAFTGRAADGREVDLWSPGAAPDARKPDHVLDTLPSRRWGKLLLRLRQPDHAHHRPALLRYLMRRHAAATGVGITEATWTFWRETPPGPNGGVVPVVLWHGGADAPDPPRPAVDPVARALGRVRDAAEAVGGE